MYRTESAAAERRVDARRSWLCCGLEDDVARMPTPLSETGSVSAGFESSRLVSRRRRGRRLDIPSSARGAAAAATWIVRGRLAAAPRVPRGSSSDGSRRRPPRGEYARTETIAPAGAAVRRPGRRRRHEAVLAAAGRGVVLVERHERVGRDVHRRGGPGHRLGRRLRLLRPGRLAYSVGAAHGPHGAAARGPRRLADGARRREEVRGLGQAVRGGRRRAPRPERAAAAAGPVEAPRAAAPRAELAAPRRPAPVDPRLAAWYIATVPSRYATWSWRGPDHAVEISRPRGRFPLSWRRVAATPRLGRGLFHGDEARRRRGCDDKIPRRRVAQATGGRRKSRAPAT